MWPSLRRSNISGPAGDVLRKHFGSSLESLICSSRNFPITARVDLQKALEGLLAGSNLYGLHREFAGEGVSLASLLGSSRMPVTLAPPQFDDIDVGEDLPARCLRQGMWLATWQGRPLVVLLGRMGQMEAMCGRNGCVLEVGLPAAPGAYQTGESFLALLEERIRQAGSYRGKVLSLEVQDRYTGMGGSILVHRLASVQRQELILPEKTLRLLERNIHDFVAQREQLRKLGMPLKKGLLFYGPPGTGKTHTIHYLASQLPDHTTLLVTAEQVGNLAGYLRLARFLQPAMIVIEDVDLIGRERSNLDTAEEILLNKLLNEMDGLREDAALLFVLTTNRPETLEAALCARPGRIDQAIEFPTPDPEGRRQLALLYARGLEVLPETLEMAVERTEGASAAFIKELMRRSAQYYLRDGGEGGLRPAQLEQALTEIVFDGGSLNVKLLGGAWPQTSSGEA